MSHVPSAARRRATRVVAATIGLALGALAGMVATLPAAEATPPPGAQTQLVIDPNGDGVPVLHPSLAATSGTWTYTSYIFPVSPDGQSFPTSADMGCPAGDFGAYAATLASANPGAPGSPERPAITAGETAVDAFGYMIDGQSWPPADVPGLQMSPGTQVYTSQQWKDAAATGDFGTHGQQLKTAWPAGTTISVIGFCASGLKTVQSTGGSTSPIPIVDADATGHAITSWLQFTTTADPNNPTLTSAGFEGAGGAPVLVKPTVALSDSWSGSTDTLTATLTSPAGAALSDATGTVQFATVAGGTTTPVGSPVAVTAAGTASMSLTGMSPGDQAAYVATYTPDSAAAATYDTAQSTTYTVFAPAATTTTSLTVGGGLAAGASQTLTASVAPSSAAGVVTFSEGAATLGTATVSAGAATLVKALPAGAHSVVASFQPADPNAYTASQSAPSAFSVTSSTTTTTPPPAPAAVGSTVVVKVGPKKVTRTVLKRGRARATIIVAAPGTTATGTVTVTVGGKRITATLVGGRAIVKLPKIKRPGKRVIVTVTYSGTSTVTPSVGKTSVKVKR